LIHESIRKLKEANIAQPVNKIKKKKKKKKKKKNHAYALVVLSDEDPGDF
jgi:hypothetical protein